MQSPVPNKIIIGIESHEKNPTEYIVKMLLTKSNVTFTNLTIDVFNKILSANETNQTLFTYQIQEAGEYKVVFQLIYYNNKNIEVIEFSVLEGINGFTTNRIREIIIDSIVRLYTLKRTKNSNLA